MKVLSYIDYVNKGGMETLISDIANNITENDFELYIVSGNGGELEKDLENSNAKYIRFNRKRAIDFKLIRKIREIIISEKIDIIHSHNDISGFYDYMASTGLKIKRINTIHGYPTQMKERIIIKHLIRKSQKNIYVSKSFLKNLENNYGIKNIKSEVLYNGVDFKKFENSLSRNNHKSEFEIGSDCFVIGMTGNFTKGKDHITLSKAMKRVLKSNKNIKLILIGGKSEREEYIFDNCYKYCKENDLLNNILFLGKRDDITELLEILDIFILSTNSDTFGIAAIEAMYMNIPCILTNIETMIEIADNGKNAIYFKKNNPDDLANKIEFCIKNKDNLKNMANNAKQWVTDKFGITVHIENLKNIYNSVFTI